MEVPLKDIMLLFPSVISLFGIFYLVIIEHSKSKLKRVEYLFGLQCEGAKKFNELYHTMNLENYFNPNDNEIAINSIKNIDIKKLIREFRTDYEYLFDDSEIEKSIEEVITELNKYDELLQIGEEDFGMVINDVYSQMENIQFVLKNTNNKIRKYILKQTR